MWCYLAIAFFDWEIDFFQQTMVGVYCILKAEKGNPHCLGKTIVKQAGKARKFFYNYLVQVKKVVIILKTFMRTFLIVLCYWDMKW